ncbi:MAG: cyclic nucleotide-binding domain-containing protein [Balneolaceae bacterium]
MNEQENHPLDSSSEEIRALLSPPPPILTGFHYEDMVDFLKLGEVRQYQNGDPVDETEDSGSPTAFMVVSGDVSLWGDGIQLTRLNQGSFYGEAFLFKRETESVTLQADSELSILIFKRFEVLTYFKKRPAKLFNIFMKNIIELQQGKIKSMNQQIVQLKRRLLDQHQW